jgi:hypothetical protein
MFLATCFLQHLCWTMHPATCFRRSILPSSGTQLKYIYVHKLWTKTQLHRHTHTTYLAALQPSTEHKLAISSITLKFSSAPRTKNWHSVYVDRTVNHGHI